MADAPDHSTDEEQRLVVPTDEEMLLARVERSLAARASSGPRVSAYDQELVSLRDEIAEARMEDVPALIAQMERLQGVSLRRAEATAVLVDPRSPYFGHLRLREKSNGRVVERDVLIGRATFVDPESRVNIVDWRHAPVSELYYRYDEGSDYEERFGNRDVEGEILARRTVTIEEAELLRVATADGVWAKRDGRWEHVSTTTPELAGGQGTAARVTKGKLGAGQTRRQRLDRHLPEIAALIDPRQFELITAPDAGVVVIQGGAGSGKTTIGLHRIAYLAYRAPDRFAPKRMLVVTYGAALAAYISQVLPALGVHGVGVVTFQAWADKQLRKAVPWLKVRVTDDASPVVSRLKSHPALLHELERRAGAYRGKRSSRAVVELWADLLTDRARLEAVVGADAQAPMTAAELAQAHRQITDRVQAVLEMDPRDRGDEPTARERAEAEPDDDEVRGATGIDGLETEGSAASLDVEDVALLLRAHQKVRGASARSPSRSSHALSHLFVDEAQDLSPTQLSVLIGETDDRRSVTLAGDTAQRLFLENGFGDWRSVLHHLALDHVAVEPLKISYRSTREILAVARHAMGSLADAEPPSAPRSGAPVEAHVFPGAGAAVAFLAEALRDLAAREPRATVAVLARHAEQADRYFDGLRRGEVPSLRRVRAQDFAFRPGVEVTEIRQVKGLEFDYVVLVDANASTFGTDDESRHLFHIAATRAAHQLWLLVTASASKLIPAELVR